MYPFHENFPLQPLQLKIQFYWSDKSLTLHFSRATVNSHPRKQQNQYPENILTSENVPYALCPEFSIAQADSGSKICVQGVLNICFLKVTNWPYQANGSFTLHMMTLMAPMFKMRFLNLTMLIYFKPGCFKNSVDQDPH